MLNVDFNTASAEQISDALAERLRAIRLARNLTQAELAREAGVSSNTIGRLEQGLSVSVETLIRTLIALRLQHNLQTLLPDPAVRPVDRLARGQAPRQRARPVKPRARTGGWVWGDEKDP